MADNRIFALIIVVVICIGILGFTLYQPNQSGGGSGVTPNSCPTSPQEYAVSVVDSSGTLGCMEVSASTGIASIIQGSHTLTGDVTFANSTTIGIDVSGNTIYWKVLSVPWSLLTSVPNIVNTLAEGSHTISGAVTFVNSTSIGIDVSGQNVILKFQAQSCSAGTAVISVADTIACSSIVSSITQGSHTIRGALTVANSTTVGLDVSGQTLYFKVLSVPWASLSGVPNIVNSIAQGSYILKGAVAFVNSTSIGVDVSGQNIVLKLLSQSCNSPSLVSAIGNAISCTHAILSVSQGAYTDYGALTLVNSTTIGVFVSGQNFYFKVTTVPWSLLTSFPSNCATHNWVMGATSGSFTCSQPSWSDIGSIPSNCAAGSFYTSLSSGTCAAPAWTSLTSFPSACPAGEWTGTIASSPTCTYNLDNRLTSPTATASGTKSTGLTISLLASTNYAFEAYLDFASPTSGTSTTDFQIHALASGAALVVVEATCHHTGTTVLADDIAGIATAVTSNILPTVLVNSLTYYCTFSGVVTVGTTPTTLQLDVVAAATSGSVASGSFMVAQVIA